MKKAKLAIIILLLFFSITPVNVFAVEQNTIISIDGEIVEFNRSTGYPFLDGNSRTQVPFRVTLEKFGAKVDWEQRTRTAIAEKDGIRVEVPIGERYIVVNGKRIENDTVALIVDSKTYLPIRKVMEAFGAEVLWNSEIQSVDIISQKPKEEFSEELQEMIKTLEKKVIFDNDISIFTLYSFMNFTGYDEENNPQGFHEVRKMVRDDLEKMNLSLMDNNYYTNKKVLPPYYRQVLARMDGAPNFTVGQALPNYLSDLNDLGIHLKDFYEKANIEELFNRYKSYYQEELDRYSKLVYPTLAKANQLLKISEDKIPEFYFQVNLLEAYWRGYGLGNTYVHKGGKGILITGPSDEVNLINIVHEYLHGIITPINYELIREIEELSFLMAKVPKNTQASSPSYNNWISIFDESMIRALSTKFIDDGASHIQHQMREGFILAEYFDTRFNEFESYEGSLKEFIRMLISDIAAESK